MKYNYNLSGSNRKPLIEAISQILDQPAAYQGAPSFSYIIGNYTVDRNGVLSYNSTVHPDFAAVLVGDLQERGFVAETVAIDNPAEEPGVEEFMTEVSVGEETPADEVTEVLAGETQQQSLLLRKLLLKKLQPREPP